MPIIPILSGVAAFFAGAFAGDAIKESTKNPDIVIAEGTVQKENGATKTAILILAIAAGIYILRKK